MQIRTYQPGDEAAQAAIYNEAAAALPKFKPATEQEVRRRCQAMDFDPTTRLFAEVNGQAVGYATFHSNGRVSYPWCRKGHERLIDPLFQSILSAIVQRGQHYAFTAYRDDWKPQQDFFLTQGFRRARDMVNFAADPLDLPTRPENRHNPITALRSGDLQTLMTMAPRSRPAISGKELEKAWLQNPYFPAEALFVLRSKGDERPLAVGVFITNPQYANAKLLDADMPCFRLGAFGTEGMQVKRINGLFSFMAAQSQDPAALALDLLAHAVALLEQQGGIEVLAAQVPSDVPYLVPFYDRYFRRQGSFPIFERSL
jgi:hypothetical protein